MVLFVYFNFFLKKTVPFAGSILTVINRHTASEPTALTFGGVWLLRRRSVMHLGSTYLLKYLPPGN